jgi:hypothetical protein
VPEIAPATPLLPASPAPVAAATPVAPTEAGASVPDFLGQLKAALKNLAGALPVLPTAPQPVTPGVAGTDATTTPTADEATAPKTTAQPSADVMEILATLGFVPAPLQPPVAPPTDGEVLAAPLDAKAMPQATGGPAQAQTAASAQAEPKRTDSAPAVASEVHAKLDDAMTTVTPAPVAPTALESQTVSQPPKTATTDAAAPAESAATTAVSQVLPREPQTTIPVPAPAASVAHTALVQPHLQNDGGTSQQNTGGDDSHQQHAATATTHVAASTETSSPPVIDPTLAAAGTNAAASTTAAPQPTNIHPGQVVSQIAQQSDLYRLPGNRGVRIQLHPDDLGGVQVTVRYAAGGGLELHINVEAGWTQLRDALATQGISPDRLVMSVTGPGSANQLDFSSNGSNAGYRPDQGLSTFTQSGQSGQQQQGASDEPTTRRAWNPGAGEPSPSDDQPRAAAVAAASRIDYRV